jgi:hypothetical protein
MQSHHQLGHGSALAMAGLAITSIALGLAVATMSPAAAATTATVKLSNPTSGPSVVYDGGTGNRNNLRIVKEGAKIAVTDSVPIVAGAGCTVVAVGKALCEPTFSGRSVRSVFVLLKDLSDTASVEGAFTGQVFGDAGDDFLRAGQGDAGGHSAIGYNGGPGFDTVSYSRSPIPVRVTMDDQNNDGGGTFGGRDNVRDDVEQISGSEFGDSLTGDERFQSFLGLGGGDTITPGGGADQVFGASGDDVLHLRDGFADVADGGPGTDRAVIDRSLDRPTGVESIS